MIGALLICAALTVVDGDTVKCDGELLRDMGDGAPMVSGYDAPELRGAKCEAEHRLAVRARQRLQDIIATPGVTIIDSGERDRYRRRLVWIRLPDGTTAGSHLIAEHLAAPWFPGHVPHWCLADRP